MNTSDALSALSALAQATRLDIFRLLITHEPDGLPAGDIAQRLDVPQTTLSSHLSILANSGIIHGERNGRSIVYRADIERFRALTLFLFKDCCGGRSEICGPMIADLTSCCVEKTCHG
ncbi:MAG: transcriptional regulator [Hyphomicrobium sp.]|nr:MAG: transcriptional regulator [Hyphomicrobium sp.]